MAEREVLVKFEEQVKCAICLDTYTDPKQLPCHHVFCRGCLVKLVYRDPEGQLILNCPECRRVTPVPANGVAGLQPAFQTNNLLDMQSLLKKALTEKEDASGATKATHHCSEHPRGEIKLYCGDCAKFVCIKCVVSGAKAVQNKFLV